MLIQFIKPDFEFSDVRGSLTQLVHGDWKQVNYITSVAGAYRGGHFHKRNTEAFYVVSGAFRLLVKSSGGREHEEYTMKAGDFFTIPPMVTHSFVFTDKTQLISLYNHGVENVDGSKDIHTSEEEEAKVYVSRLFLRNHEELVKKGKKEKKDAGSKIS